MDDPQPGHELTMSRDLPGRPEQVFAMLTEPTGLRTWWGPHGFTTPRVELDLRVGGAFRFSMQPPDGVVFHLSGEYLQIDPPHRLAYTFRWDEPVPDDRETVVTLTLESRDDTTRISLAQGAFATEERLALHRDGWADSFDKLRDALASG